MPDRFTQPLPRRWTLIWGQCTEGVAGILGTLAIVRVGFQEKIRGVGVGVGVFEATVARGFLVRTESSTNSINTAQGKIPTANNS